MTDPKMSEENADSKRLDWLERGEFGHLHVFSQTRSAHIQIGLLREVSASTLRLAIDAAIQAEEEKK